MAYNQEHGIIPKTIVGKLRLPLRQIELEEELEVAEEADAGVWQNLKTNSRNWKKRCTRRRSPGRRSPGYRVGLPRSSPNLKW